MTGGIFTGTIRMAPLVNADTGAVQLKSALVCFPAGVRNKLHSHTHEQILFVTKGKGIVAAEDHEHVVEPGDMVVIPAGEMHWHGATDETDFEHLYVVPLNSSTTY
ncbi:cupin domain-containing protein [Candidatus Bathyarchaeota archaeon]|nr:cupin domain-containing protein [Candidatus Bathyarchaeota archaeon]